MFPINVWFWTATHAILCFSSLSQSEKVPLSVKTLQKVSNRSCPKFVWFVFCEICWDEDDVIQGRGGIKQQEVSGKRGHLVSSPGWAGFNGTLCLHHRGGTIGVKSGEEADTPPSDQMVVNWAGDRPGARGQDAKSHTHTHTYSYTITHLTFLHTNKGVEHWVCKEEIKTKDTRAPHSFLFFFCIKVNQLSC